MRPSPAREALLEAADQLFYSRGIRMTSVEDILERAGVARQSLYQHFDSKDGLAAVFLANRDDFLCNAMSDFVAVASDDPVERVLAVYDFLAVGFSSDDFYGCAFINSAAEYCDPSHPFHAIATRHKMRMCGDIEHLCKEAGLANPRTLARQLLMLLDGAIVTEQVTRGSGGATEAKGMARILIQAHRNGDKA